MTYQDSISYFHKLNQGDSSLVDTIQSLETMVDTTSSGGFTQTFITGKGEKIEILPERLNVQQNDWIHFVLLACLVFITLAKFLFRKDLVRVGKSFFSMRESYILERESRMFKETYVFLLSTVFVLSFSSFCFLTFKQMAGYSGDSLSELILFGKIFSVISLGWLVKNLLIGFIGVVFKTGFASYFHRVNNLLFNLNIGLFFVIGAVLLQYTTVKYVAVVAVVILAIAYIYRTVRNFMIGITQSGFSYIYIILYLCALEIAPVFIGLKLLYEYYL